ncbi:hypothetical protein DICPUDRAFT_158520 [Dictyostelium purpureum]|uniref:Uncharacterized protein n=1 Tax=Dictyostelium purpureum TaxID=5786 RepID=F1A1T4_DICPU|nr:uncharacterized protein DICPUDRAFT_158520 [Dictyostelium purpureum]EGC29855.1 hypothetical protein DICPUDRAFT_158520 [Dictyostelium purpureum]|eukprot:XP_003293629.1 hypothetical protein DICPUDRAFT_158520 [Dictyostelium purpureum]
MSSLLIESTHTSVQDDLKSNIEKNHPVKSKTVSKKINNIDTDIAISVFADTVFITISQNQKFNTWIKAYKSEGVLLDEPSYQVDVLLGSNQDTLLGIYARQLIENIGLSSRRQLLLSISITDKSKDSFKQILQTIFDNKIW